MIGGVDFAGGQKVLPVTTVSSHRILIVDDNADAAKLFARLLKVERPHEVELAHRGEAVLPRMEQFRPNLVLLDIGLPDISGYQVARTIRDDRRFDEVLLVALTGYGEEEDRQRAYEAGFDEHLVKPPTLDAFRQLFCHPKLDGRADGNGKADGNSKTTAMTPSIERIILEVSDDEMGEVALPSHASRLGKIVHELGNMNCVVSMAGTILEQSKDPAQVQSVGRMLRQLAPSIQTLIASLQELRRELNGQAAGEDGVN